MVAASDYSGAVEVLLGTGNGMFGPATSHTPGNTATGVAAGDINGDGHNDIVASIDNAAAVLVNNGDGTFQAGLNWFVGSVSRDVVLGDFDNDGDRDIAAALHSTVSILLNDGTGLFTGPTSYSGGANSMAMAAGDFDVDGDVDIVLANYNFGGTISVLLGNGNGSFAAPKRFRTAGQHPRTLTVGDFNGDARPDFAVANRGSSTVAVLLNQGNAVWVPKPYATGASPWGVTSADINSDGHDPFTSCSAIPTGRFHRRPLTTRRSFLPASRWAI
jgi:hypothetical protein